MSRVVVIGAGLAGLSAACHLRAQGREVLVLERENVPGGRNGVLHREGFTFDTGPTVLTMIDLLGEAFTAVGADVRDELELTQLDPAYRAVFADGSTLLVRHGHEAMRAEIEQQCGAADAAAFDDFVRWLRRLYDVEVPNFIDRNFNRPTDLLSRPKAAVELVRLGAFGRLGAEVRRRFRDERLHRIFSFQAMYAGLAPDQALALYAVITYMDSIEGVWFPAGGMRAVPAALAAAAQRAGVEFRYETSVSEVLTRSDGAVTAVALADGERLAADAVVCTLDLPIAYEKLLPDLPLPRALRRPQYSPSALVWHLGVRGDAAPACSPQNRNGIAHHNIHFGGEWASAFDDLLVRGTPMHDPSRLVTVPSLDDTSAAPAGGSTLFVLEPVPNTETATVNWSREMPRLRERLLSFLGENGYPTDIVTETLVGPREWAEQGMAAGTPFSLAHTFAQTGPFRPANIERRRPGFVFAGSGTTPGVGVPMVLISGKLAAARVGEYLP